MTCALMTRTFEIYVTAYTALKGRFRCDHADAGERCTNALISISVVSLLLPFRVSM